jgi:ribosomal subunit interface protein
MQEPVRITFRNLPPSDAVTARIHERIAELERFDSRIIGCRVLVEARHRRQRKGRLYRVAIELVVPGGEVVVSRDPDQAHEHEDVYVAIRDAFNAAARQLEDEVRRTRLATKLHEVPPHGRVVRLFVREGYGFIATADGDEVYFHRNSVVDGRFDELGIGSEVRFVVKEGEGAHGPQASTVTPLGKHHLADVEWQPT